MLVTKTLVVFPGCDNWDRVINELDIRPDDLEAITEAYAAKSSDKDFRRRPIKQQFEILKSCCRTETEFYLMLVNIGMDTQNWILANQHTQPK